MASEAKTRTNKQSVVTFTLPVSCQICLGKVKQPVLCPNLHVFCQLCMDTWLERQNHCPACRVEIGPDNPVKHIIGGRIEDENAKSHSTPDLRRARFDLLWNEYEEHFEKMRKECIILRTENDILLAHLKDAEEKDKRNKGAASKAQEEPSLLLLTKNLQEAEKLYNDIKGDMARLKQENTKLKDENVNLTRENENLRIEIAQRSPKKFGRYTVATLETKVAEQEKEIRQLKSAMERSDKYIEDLQSQVEKYGKNSENERGANPVKTGTTPGTSRFWFSTEPSQKTNDHSSNHLPTRTDQQQAVEGVRRTLFGKVFIDRPKEQTQNGNAGVSFVQRSAGEQRQPQKTQCDNNSSHHHASHPQQRQHQRIQQDNNSDHFHTQQSSSRRESHQRASHNEIGPTSAKAHNHPESIMKPSSTTFFSEDMENERSDPEDRDRTPRKVHFNVPAKTNDTSSFDLEMPSPMEKSSIQGDPPSSANKVLPTNSGEPSAAAPTTKVNFDSKKSIPDFDQKILELLQKNNLSVVRKPQLSELAHSSGPTVSSKQKGKKTPGKGKGKKTVKKKGIMKKSPRQPSPRQSQQDTNDSSHLSCPDTPDGDYPKDVKPDISDLDLSMTPELSDCLELMHKAERNIVGSKTDDFLPPAGGASIGTSVPNSGSSHQVPRPSSVPPHLPSARFAPPSQYLPSSATNGIGVAPASGTMSSWEQQFFSTLRANPYRFSNPTKYYDASLNIKQEPIDPYQGPSQEFPSSLDYNPTKNSVDSSNFHFSEPIRVNKSASQNHTGRPMKPLASPTQMALQGPSYNPFALHLNIPSSVGSSIGGTAIASSYSYGKASPSVIQSTSSYSHNGSSLPPTQINSKYATSLSTLSSNAPLSSFRSSLATHSSSSSSSYQPEVASYKSSYSTEPTSYSNHFPSFLNKSELEWPDDTPGRGGKDAQVSSDDLSRPTPHRESLDDSFMTFKPPGASNHYSYVSNASNSDLSASTFLPEPKKRLFETADELDFSISPKSSKK